MNTITIELCQEDRNRLDTLLATVLELAGKHVTEVAPVAPYEAADAAPEVAAPTTPAEPEKPVEVAETPEAPKYKMTDVQQLVVSLSAAGKKDQVREIVKAYAERVTLIPEDKFGEVMDKLHALEVGA